MSDITGIQKDGVNGPSPSELYEHLQQRTNQLSKAAFERMRTEAAKMRFFRCPLLPDWRECSPELREFLSTPAGKDHFFAIQLRNCKTNADRLFLLANWLYQEGLCQPEDVLGKQFSQYQKAAFRGAHGALSLTDLRQAFIVEEWRLYFEWLLRERKARRDLLKLGFAERAIQAALRKRSPIAAACEWVAERLGVDAPALSNAYCRIFRETRKANPNPCNNLPHRKPA